MRHSVEYNISSSGKNSTVIGIQELIYCIALGQSVWKGRRNMERSSCAGTSKINYV